MPTTKIEAKKITIELINLLEKNNDQKKKIYLRRRRKITTKHLKNKRQIIKLTCCIYVKHIKNEYEWNNNKKI